jgi:hypothetical protein
MGGRSAVRGERPVIEPVKLVVGPVVEDERDALGDEFVGIRRFVLVVRRK